MRKQKAKRDNNEKDSQHRALDEIMNSNEMMSKIKCRQNEKRESKRENEEIEKK